MIYMSNYGTYGHCWIEGNNGLYLVYIMNGYSKHGPYTSLNDAIAELEHWSRISSQFAGS